MGKASILVVEDEAIVAADIGDCLKHLGYRVCTIASSGKEAIENAQKFQPDLVLMDIKLKGKMDGIEAAAYMRKAFDIPVVYLTAHGDEGTLERAKVTEPYGYILKPFEETELRIALELALHKHQMLQQPAKSGKTTADASSVLNEALEVLSETDGTFKPKHDFLRRIEPFSRLDEQGLAMFASGCHLRQYAAGEMIAYEHDANVEGFFVFSGRVAMLKTSISGRQLIVELLPPGDVFGLIVAIDKQSYPLTARAQITSQLLWAPRSAILRLLDTYPELYRSFVEVISDRLRTSYNFSRALAHDRVDVRIASALCALVPHFGALDASKEVHHIQITRQELADLTGSSVETAIRTTKNMERDGLLDLTESGTVKIKNYELLQEVSDS